MSIDHRRHYVLVLDTETANTISDESGLDMSNVLFYDIGWAVVDTKGHVYRTRSFVNRDIFCYERDLMRSCYYAKKIPQYINEIRDGSRVLADIWEIRKTMLDDMAEFGITEVAAHNARFDYNGTNTTQRYITKSKYRYFFPFGTEIWDTMKMAQDVICKMPTYIDFCNKHGFVLKNGQPRKTAEVLYRFISRNPDFKESHTGLEDVLIEAEIMFYCFRQHKPMRKKLFENSREFPKPTEFQKALMRSIKETPTLRYC